MPELPDVQVFKEYLDATSLHKPIEHVYVSAAKVLADVSPSTLRRHMDGEELNTTRRHGKHLFARLSDEWLHLHFGMTGRPEYYEDGAGDRGVKHTRMRLDFRGGGHLAYVDPRRLGEVGLTADPETFIEGHDLGPDALDPSVDVDALASMLEKRRGVIKSALMNQAVIAGIGNVYSDEILFQAGIHPGTDTGKLDDQRVRELHRQTKRVLNAAIDARVEDFPDWFLLPHRHEDGDCPRCGSRLRSAKIAGRTSWFCPKDQRE